MSLTRSLLRQALLFGAVWAAGFGAVHALKRLASFNAPFFWPMSIFHPRVPGLGQCLVLAGALALFLWAQRVGIWRRGRTALLLTGSALVLLSNLGQGWPTGLSRPVAGEYAGARIQYYHDAIALPDALGAFRGFNALQPTLNDHSRSHPPGALFLFRVLADWLRAPALIGLALSLAALLLCGVHLERFLQRFVTPERARWGVWLFFLLPAVQIYFAVSLDALIAALFLAVLASFHPQRSWTALAPTVLFLFLAANLTFAVLFLPPVLLWTEWRQTRRAWRTLGLCAAVGLLLTAMGLLLGYDYWQAFFTASRLENPEGFWLLADPLSYLATRIEDVAEPLLFLGPFAVAAIGIGLRRGTGPWRDWTLAGLVTFALLLLSGAFRTGETARAGLFLLPLLLLPMLDGLSRTEPTRERLLPLLLFAQALGMQALGRYYW